MSQQPSNKSIAPAQQQSFGSEKARGQWEQLLGSKAMVLALLFGVTGFLGLPVLWMSHVFTTAEKIAWSIANTIYTLILIGIVVWICYWCYSQFQAAGII